MIAFLLALAAILGQPTPPPVEFVAAVLGDCRPVILPGSFAGCEQAHPGDDDPAYAGLLWRDGRASLETGP